MKIIEDYHRRLNKDLNYRKHQLIGDIIADDGETFITSDGAVYKLNIK